MRGTGSTIGANETSFVVVVVTSTVLRVGIAMQSLLLQALAVRRIALARLFMHHILEGSSDVLGLALESIVALLASAQDASMCLELGHGHGRELGGLVVLGGVMVHFVNRNGRVDNVWLNCFLLDYGLNSLVDMMVHMLSRNDGSSAVAVCRVRHDSLILESLLFCCKVPLRSVKVAMVEFAMLHGAELGGVLLWKDFAVVDRLYCTMVMILMGLFVDRLDDMLVLVRLHSLMLNRWCDLFVDGGFVLSGPVHKVGDGCLGFFHCEKL